MRCRQILPGLMLVLGLVGVSVDTWALGCARFNDPGAVFCEDFEDQLPNAPSWQFESYNWAIGTDGTYAALQSPGLGGSNVKLKLYAFPMPAGSSGSSQTAATITPFSVHFNNGETYWVEWTETYGSDYVWRMGCFEGGTCNSNHKDFDLRFNAESNGNSNRLLFGPNDGGNNGQFMQPLWAAYADTIDRNLTPNVGSLTVTQGSTVHWVLEITNAVYPNGRLRFWGNNVLLMDYPNIQTCRNVNGCTMADFHIGGPQGLDGSTFWVDQIRMTRTNLSPTRAADASPPAPPTNLRVN